MAGGPFAQVWSYRGKIKLTFSFLFYNTPNPAISMSVAQSRCGFYLGGGLSWCNGNSHISGSKSSVFNFYFIAICMLNSPLVL